MMKINNLILRQSCELYWGEAWLSLWRALEARSLAVELVRLHKGDCPLRLLDAGSGDGRFFDLLSYAVDLLAGGPLAATIQGIGLEQGRKKSLGMLKRGSPLFPIRGDITALPFQDHVMDVVLSNSTLEHIGNVEKAISEFSRVLRPGGHLLFTVPSVDFERLLLRYRLGSWFGKSTATRFAEAKSARMSHLHYLHPQTWERHLMRNSFSMVSWQPIVPSAVVAWGDALQTLRDIGIGGAQTSLRRPGQRLVDLPFRLVKRLCIELETGIAHLAFGRDQGEIAEGDGGAYMIVAQQSCVRTPATQTGERLMREIERTPLVAHNS